MSHASPSLSSPRRVRATQLLLAATATLWLSSVGATGAATDAPPSRSAKPASAPETIDAKHLFAAIVRVETQSVPDARSARTLGTEREGSGIVIGDDGLILTIGYLLVEATAVTITDSRGRALPARVVGYDHATGLGLLRSVVPLDVKPVPFGDSAQLAEREPVMIVNSAGADDVTLAYVVSRRPFAGSWEYLLDRAIFTSPPSLGWSGAALVAEDGRLLGVGSLMVRDALAGEQDLSGNMFVPIDVLKPILADLVRDGRRAGPARPWLGLAAEEVKGRLFVDRVSPDGPADRAGIRVGDIILAVGGDGVRTLAEFYRKVWRRGAAGSAIPLRILQGVEVTEIEVRSIDRVDYFRPRTPL